MCDVRQHFLALGWLWWSALQRRLVQMRLPISLLAIFLLAAPLLNAQAAEPPKQDVAGSHDHPIISRFTGSVIAGYQSLDYAEAIFPMGRAEYDKPDHFLKAARLEGKVTRIFYIAPQGKTGIEIYRNFEAALRRGGFNVTYACAGNTGVNGCGGFNFADYLVSPLLDPMHSRNLMIDALKAIDGNVRYLSAHLERDAGNVDISLLVSEGDRTPPGILLQIVEAKPMTTGQVSVDAKAMNEGLSAHGHIALYGIHFTSDSATLEKDSDDTLQQMATLLRAHPGLKVFIVGHTDNSGSASHNAALSEQRAQQPAKRADLELLRILVRPRRDDQAIVFAGAERSV